MFMIFQGIKVYLGPTCDGVDDIIDADVSVTLDVSYNESCSGVAITEPSTNWVFNQNEAGSDPENPNKLPIIFY